MLCCARSPAPWRSCAPQVHLHVCVRHHLYVHCNAPSTAADTHIPHGILGCLTASITEHHRAWSPCAAASPPQACTCVVAASQRSGHPAQPRPHHQHVGLWSLDPRAHSARSRWQEAGGVTGSAQGATGRCRRGLGPSEQQHAREPPGTCAERAAAACGHRPQVGACTHHLQQLGIHAPDLDSKRARRPTHMARRPSMAAAGLLLAAIALLAVARPLHAEQVSRESSDTAHAAVAVDRVPGALSFCLILIRELESE